ncbi:hypothetical protein WN944_022965 [Citrus x changshan-huyou]|uniref:Uncharacterized protein n=1 Tax=Citrus x changshan-huyou TaxID=2935761 RepID=A0AAP0MZI6_9ROSI
MTVPKAQKKPAEKKPVGSISSHEIQQEADDHAEGDPDHCEIGHARCLLPYCRKISRNGHTKPQSSQNCPGDLVQIYLNYNSSRHLGFIHCGSPFKF